MSILFITTLDDHWGGSEELWARTARLALLNGHKVTVCMYSRKSLHERISGLKELGAKIVFMKSRTSIANAGLLVKAYYALLQRIRPDFNIRKLNSGSYSSVCLSQANTFEHAFNEDIYCYLKTCRSPVYLISQLNHEHFALPYGIIRRSRELIEKSEKMFFVSKRNLETAVRQLAAPIPNGVVIDNPLNLKSAECVKYPSSEIPSFASVARFDMNYKAQDLILQVLGTEKWKKRDWRLNFYGEGIDKEYLNDLISFYGLSDKVRIKGHVADIQSLWAENNLLILPSLAEGKPLALEEAMICGRTAVVTDVAGNTELITDGITGFVAKAPTLFLIDEALERAWGNRDMWEEMGLRAHHWAKENLDPEPERTLLNYIVLKN